MTILIVEGCDGAGKSTLLELAAARLDWPPDFVMTLPRDDMKAYWRRNPAEATATNVLNHVLGEMRRHCATHPFAVFDRGWPSTFVYQENPVPFADLPEVFQTERTIIYLVQPALEELRVRKAKRDGVGVGAGLADHLNLDELYAKYAAMRPQAPNHIVVVDEGPDVDKFVEICVAECAVLRNRGLPNENRA